MGCQAEEATVSSTNLENHANHRHINFEKFSELFPQPASKILQQNDKSTRALGRNGVYDPVNDFTILTDEIFMAEKDGEIYFTFAITRENGDFSGLENLVLSSDGLGGFTPALAKYAITEAEKDKLERGEIVEDIAQKASIVPLENVDFGGISVSGKFTCYTLTISWCGEGNHAGGIDGGHSCPAHQEMTVPLGCDDDGGSNPGGPGGNYPGTPSPGSGAGGGGGGSAPYVPPTNGNPGNPPSNGPQDPGTGMNPGGGGSGGGPKKPLITHPLYIPVPPRTLDTFLFYLSAEELSWLNNPNNSEAKNAINAYVASTGFNDQSMELGKELINISKDLKVNAVEIWQNIPDYRGMMSQAELEIFDTMLINRKLWYLASGKKALERTQELFPSFTPTLHNGKGDAFRHAFWNGLSALRIGSVLTEQLTTAHENRPPSSLNPFEYKEVEMDLHNNSQGLIASQYSNLSTIEYNVLARFNSGYLVYLNNLQIAPPYYPTIYSVLIPTNQ